MIETLVALTFLSTLVVWMATVRALRWRRSRYKHNLTINETSSSTPSISILKPLRGMEPNLRENLESFFNLNGSVSFELLFSVKNSQDKAVKVVQALMEQYPHISARLFVNTPDWGRNPKVSNMHYAWNRALSDLILISDSNVKVPPDYLETLMTERREGAGLVTQAIYGGDASTMAGHLDVAHLNTFYLKGTAFLEILGHSNVLGKCMLFSRSRFDGIGGLSSVKNYLAEDLVSGEMMREKGEVIKIAPRLLRQTTITTDIESYWNRHVRWARLRKCHFPWAYLIEPLLFETFWPVLLMVLFPEPEIMMWGCFILGFQQLSNVLLHVFVFDDPSAWKSYRWFLVKDLFAPIVWMGGLLSNRVIWRGQPMYLQFGGELRGHQQGEVWE